MSHRPEVPDERSPLPFFCGPRRGTGRLRAEAAWRVRRWPMYERRGAHDRCAGIGKDASGPRVRPTHRWADVRWAHRRCHDDLSRIAGFPGDAVQADHNRDQRRQERRGDRPDRGPDDRRNLGRCRGSGRRDTGCMPPHIRSGRSVGCVQARRSLAHKRAGAAHRRASIRGQERRAGVARVAPGFARLPDPAAGLRAAAHGIQPRRRRGFPHRHSEDVGTTERNATRRPPSARTCTSSATATSRPAASTPW